MEAEFKSDARESRMIPEVPARRVDVRVLDHATATAARPMTGGKGGIRTHGGLAPTAVFKTAALNHSATSPARRQA